jgi:hypothetical protein
MKKYQVTLTEAEVREALREWVQTNVHPNHTLGDVVYVSHDLFTGNTTAEFSYPLPDADDPGFEGAAV